MPTKTGLAAYLSQHSSFSNPISSISPLPSLYSDLSRQRKSNPAGYAASVEWWKSILQDVTFRGVQFDHNPAPSTSSAGLVETVDRTIFKLDESTKSRWTVDGVGRPLGLGTVISELEKDGIVVGYNTFLNAKEVITAPRGGEGRGLSGYIPTPGGLASAVLLKPAKWAVSQLYSLTIGAEADEEGEYSEDELLFRQKKGDWVFYSLVERLATAFLTQHYTEATISPLSCLMTTAEFRSKLNAICKKEFGFHPSERDANLVLKHLARDRPGTLYQNGIIKLAPVKGESIEAITEEDRSVIAVRSTLHRVELQITSLESQISQRTFQAKTSLKNGQKSQASSYLRSRKTLTEVLEKRMGTRETLTQVVLKIEQAKSDVEVMRAYKASDEVLRSVLGREEMKMENVEKVMEGLEESMASQREVDEVLRGNGVGMGGEEVDEEELERELARLVEEKRLEEEGEKEKEEKRRQDEVERTKRLAESERERTERTQRLAESERARTQRLAQAEVEQREREQEREEGRKQNNENDELLARFEKLRVAQVPTTLADAAGQTSTSDTKPQQGEQGQKRPEAAS